MRYSFVDTHFKQFIDQWIVQSLFFPITDNQIQPSSMDLCLWKDIYEISCPFVPLDDSIDDLIAQYNYPSPIPESDGSFILEKNKHYLISCNEEIYLPSHIYANMSPKSSIGRIDLHVRMIGDNNKYYDHFPFGYQGKLWFIITANSFSTQILPGTPVNQMMLFEEKSLLQTQSFQALYNKDQEAMPAFHFSEQSMVCDMSIDIQPGETAGYRAKNTDKILDIRKTKNNIQEDFFELIETGNQGKLKLEKDGFYIFTSYERITVPADYSCEMIPSDNTKGELRVHYAGFFDPGWGMGNRGDRGVLEIRPYEDIIISHRQPIAQMRYNPNIQIPEVLYGVEKKSNYAGQEKNKLSKYFQ